MCNYWDIREKAVGGNQLNLSATIIGKLDIHIPPIEEQEEIISILDDILEKDSSEKEIAEQVITKIDSMKKAKRVDSQHCMTHQVKLDYENNNGKTIYNFFVGDGIDKPDREKLERSFNTSSIIEMQGSFKVSVKSSALPDIMPNIYHDAKGQLWYIESPIDGLVIPEICLHFLTISALCNIMRYSPHEWNMIISNRISSTSSLLIHEYISLFELKFPMLVVEMLTNYLPTLQ